MKPVEIAIGLFALLGASGCISEPKLETPPMPRIVAGPASTPAKKIVPSEVVADALAQAMVDNLAGAVTTLDRLEADQRVDAARDLVQRLAASDVAKASRLALLIPAGPAQTAATAAVGRAFAERDVNAAIRWAGTISDIEARVAALRAIAARLFEQDSGNAITRLDAAATGEHRVEVLSLSASEWAHRDPNAALAWAQHVEDAELRNRLLTSVGFEIAQTAPQRAIAIAESIPPGRDRWILLGAIGRNWVVRDASAAWAWARQQPEGDARQAAIAGIEAGLDAYGTPVIRAPRQATLTMLSPSPRSVSPGIEQDERTRREFEDRLTRSPALTGDWLLSLPPSERRDEYVEKLAREWLATNPAAAKQWLDQNIPSDARRREILQEAGVGVTR